MTASHCSSLLVLHPLWLIPYSRSHLCTSSFFSSQSALPGCNSFPSAALIHPHDLQTPLYMILIYCLYLPTGHNLLIAPPRVQPSWFKCSSSIFSPQVPLFLPIICLLAKSMLALLCLELKSSLLHQPAPLSCASTLCHLHMPRHKASKTR